MRGPLGTSVRRVAPGEYEISEESSPSPSPTTKLTNKSRIGFLVGGTGVLCVLPFLESALADPNDTTKFSLVCANRAESDVLLRTKLENLALTHPNRLRLFFTLENPPPGWPYGKGFLSDQVISRYLPPADERSLFLACLPTNMDDSLEDKALLRLLPPPSYPSSPLVSASNGGVINALKRSVKEELTDVLVRKLGLESSSSGRASVVVL